MLFVGVEIEAVFWGLGCLGVYGVGFRIPQISQISDSPKTSRRQWVIQLDGDAPLDVVPKEADRRLQLLILCVSWWVLITYL